MLGWRSFFLNRFECNVDNIAFVQRGKYFVVSTVIVVLCPTLFQNYHPAQHKAFAIGCFSAAHINGHFRFLHHAVLCTEHGDKTAQYHTVYFFLVLAERFFLWKFIRGGKRGMTFNFGIVKDLFAVFECDGIAPFLYALNNFFHLAFFCCGKVFRVGSRIGDIAGFI